MLLSNKSVTSIEAQAKKKSHPYILGISFLLFLASELAKGHALLWNRQTFINNHNDVGCDEKG